MSEQKSGTTTISNGEATVSIDLRGGAITDFHLHNGGINPLTFKFSPDNMPENNRSGAYYQGHFICTGRWGPPSTGEKEAGLPDHGQAGNLLWTIQPATDKKTILMQVDMPLEGLHLNRVITLDDENAVFKMVESITNTNPLGRLHNVVQHPTLAKPFLTNNTVVNCNADSGFNYMLNTHPQEFASAWPVGIMEDRGAINLSKLNKAYNSVFSFAVKKDAKFGWITAYSPEYSLLIGYLWKRQDYPWISLWQDFDGEDIRYRGLEFGTTGMHKPYKQILEEGNHKVFGEDSYRYIDAGEKQIRSYMAFMCKTSGSFTSVENVDFSAGAITIEAVQTKQQINIKTALSI